MHLDLHPKTFRIALVLVTLALCAFFLAQGATNLLASELLPVSSLNTTARAGGAKPEPPKGAAKPDMTAILGRNIFDPLTGSLWPPKSPEPTEQPLAEEGVAPAPELAPGQMPPTCEGGARLIAAIYSERAPEWSFASLALGTESPLLYRTGGQVEGKQIDAIYPEAVFLKAGNGGLCSLRLFKTGEDAATGSAKPASVAPVAPTRAAVFSGGLSEAELDQGIRAIGDNKYAVQRSLLDKVLANQGEIMRSARVVPHEENGRIIGVKLYGIRRSSILGKLGLQNGDLMRTINGFDMASPDSALEAYSKLRSASNFSVAVTRRGAAVTMDYQVGN